MGKLRGCLFGAMALVLICAGLTACAGPASSRKDVEAWLHAMITPSFQYQRTEKSGSTVTYYFKDETGLEFSASSYVSGDVIPGRALRTDFGRAWLESRLPQVDQMLAPFQRVPIQNDSNGSFQVVLPTFADIGDLAKKMANVINTLVLPLKKGYGVAPRIHVVAAGALPRSYINELWITAMRGPDDNAANAVSMSAAISTQYEGDMRKGDIDRTVDPDYARQVPPDVAVLGCNHEVESRCALPVTSSYYVTGGVVVANVGLGAGGSYTYSSYEFDFCRAGGGVLTWDFPNGLANTVHNLGGTYGTTADCQARWTINGHTWQGAQTMDPSTPSAGSGLGHIMSRNVTEDGEPVGLSVTAATGGDLTMDDLKAVLGIDFTISPVQNYAQISYIN